MHAQWVDIGRPNLMMKRKRLRKRWTYIPSLWRSLYETVHRWAERIFPVADRVLLIRPTVGQRQAHITVTGVGGVEISIDDAEAARMAMLTFCEPEQHPPPVLLDWLQDTGRVSLA
jgi:hypothetical protein